MGQSARCLLSGLVEAEERVFSLLAHLEGDVARLVKGVEVAHEVYTDLTTSNIFANDLRCLGKNHPIVLFVAGEDDVGAQIENVGLVAGNGNVSVLELRVLVQAVDLGGDLEAVILAILVVRGKHETEFKVLLVGKALSVEDDAAVKLANTLIHL